MKVLNHFIPIEILYVLGIIFTVLISCSLIFWLVSLKKKNKLITELITRVNSWWKIVIGVALIITCPPIVGTIIIGYVSFVSLREMFSIGRMRSSDRNALFIAYLSIPVQYYLAYNYYYEQFLYFIPLVMFTSIAIVLVLTGQTKRVGRSMSVIPSMVMLTVYMLSHLVLLYKIEIPNTPAGGHGLIIYIIMLTAFNDVFQYTWGKLLGKHKILPSISPNKTWEGFIGGILTSSLLGLGLSFLTPLSTYEALITGLLVGIIGFLGDSLISAIKRDLDLKDTDDLIPGHGGAMDRLDSILLTAPLFYHLLKFFISN
jgi:phosphatidate cytidylyltransferase